MQPRQELRGSPVECATGPFILFRGSRNGLASGKDKPQAEQATALCGMHIEDCFKN